MCLGKQGRWPKSSGPCTHVGDSDSVCTYWFQPVPAITLMATWIMDQQMEGISLSPLCFSGFQKKNLLKDQIQNLFWGVAVLVGDM